MKYLFYEHGELVAELDKCTVVSAADDAGVSTVLFNGKTYQRRKPVEFVQEWVAFDLVNKWAPSPVIPFDSLSADAKPSNPFKGLKYHIGNAAEFWMKECHNWRDAFERLESDVERLRNDKIVANGLIANLEGLAAADGEKIRDLESKLETVAASRERSIDDYNKSVAREGRLREEIQRINLRLADAEHERVRAVAVESELRARLAVMEEKPFIGVNLRDYDAAQFELRAIRDKLAEVEHQRDGLMATIDSMNLRMAVIEAGDVHADCATEIGRLHCIIKDRDLEVSRLKSDLVRQATVQSLEHLNEAISVINE